MKNTLSILILLISSVIYSQVSDKQELKLDKEVLLKETADGACKCIDSINTYNKKVDEISNEIFKCIDDKVVAYQLGVKLSSIKLSDAELQSGQKETKIEIATDDTSNEYKEYYYEMERYLSKNCPSMKDKMAVHDKENAYSVSSNPLALKYYSEGLDYYKEEKYEKAIECYKKAVVVDSKFAFAYDNLGICYRKLGNYDQAIEAYEKSLKIDPNGLMPLQNIAVAYQYKKEYKKAIKSYEKIAKIEPDNPEVYYGIGMIYSQFLSDNEKALDNLCQAYIIYIKQKSPYRTDAEKLIQIVYSDMKKQGKENVFNEMLKKYNINPK